MKVLFVCHGNVARSQVAEGFFKKLSTHEAASAGTGADEALERSKPATRKLRDSRDQRVVRYMMEHGIDISENERTQLAPEMVEEAGRVIVLAERDTWPDYLRGSDKVTSWDIPGDPQGDDEATRHMFEQIKQRVEGLVREIG